MFRLIEKKELADEVFQYRIEAPLIAAAHKPGQFVIVQTDSEYGERIPLTIADTDPAAGTITLIFQVVGDATHRLAALAEGDIIANVLGPLGHPTKIERVGHVVCVGGGIGVAPLYPIACAMKQIGNRLTVILGARTARLLLLENEMRAVADELILCTDDGSRGPKALVTEPLKAVCERQPRPDEVVAIGPPIMMKACANVTRPYGIRTIVSLNSIMVDGTGMCGGCRVTVGGETRFVCVDGPEFDGHQVDFENLMARLRTYKPFEQAAHERCHLELQIAQRENGHRESS